MTTKAKLTLSERMARIRKVDTTPELMVRRLAHKLGYRFRLHCRDLPGVPDLVFPGLRKVIFVHGCFWHRHTCRDGQKLPVSKPDYWGPKFARNVERDRQHLAAIEQLGWKVLVLWECELRHERKLQRALIRFLGRRRPTRKAPTIGSRLPPAPQGP